MDQLLRLARSAWPGVDVAPAVFASYLCSRLPAGLNVEIALRGIRASDLYLACACAHGDPHAIAAFEIHCLGEVDDVLCRMSGMHADAVDEVKQQIRRALLVGDGGPPRIVEFSGRGALRRWLRVLAVRQALASARRTWRETPVSERLLERALPRADDPQTRYFKRLYRAEFASAVADALSALSGHDRTILRQSFVDGLSIDELGRIYAVHRATAARWLARAQRVLASETRAVLGRRLNVAPEELTSILRLIRSGLQLNLRTIFPVRIRKRGGGKAS